MNPNLKSALLDFLANEYHLDQSAIDENLDFAADLNLNPDQINQLLEQLQDALDFTLPEDHISEVRSVGDIIRLLDPEPSE